MGITGNCSDIFAEVSLSGYCDNCVAYQVQEGDDNWTNLTDRFYGTTDPDTVTDFANGNGAGANDLGVGWWIWLMSEIRGHDIVCTNVSAPCGTIAESQLHGFNPLFPPACGSCDY